MTRVAIQQMPPPSQNHDGRIRRVLGWLRQRISLWRIDMRGLEGRSKTLDGVRGLAVLMVLASHTHFLWLWGQGAYGVWLFFALSGYLLSQPFLDRPGVTPQRYGRFLARRLLRIMPAFWATLLLFHLPIMGYGLEDTLLNASLIKMSLHFWSIKQEILLYLVLPPLVSCVAFFGQRYLTFAALLTVIGLTFYARVDENVILLDGNLPLYAAPFMMGLAAAAVVRSAVFERLKQCSAAQAAGDIFAVVFLLSIFATAPWIYDVLLSPLFGKAGPTSWAWTHYWGHSLACGALVTAALLDGKLVRAIFGNAFMRMVGILGYSIYLVHMSLMTALAHAGLPAGAPLFAGTLALSIVCAMAMYGLVERQFWQPRRDRAKAPA